MDSVDTCSMKEEKKMDANTVWQWRIMHVKKYSRCPEPFHYSNKIGLDFNVASNTQKKLDLQLVTNGVILEVCDFAETVNKSQRHFITNILENNFDLGLENEQQRIDFTAGVLHKIKDLIRNPPADKYEVFALFDASSKPECTSHSGLNMASMEQKTESVMVEMDYADDSEDEDEFKCSQVTSKQYMKSEGHSDEMDGAHADDSEDEFKCSGAQSTEGLKEDDLPSSFPYCEEIGLRLNIGLKQSLDPGLLTKGVMLELVHFTRALTASYSRIVLDVLEHNFDLDLKNKQIKNGIWFHISHLLERRKQLTTNGGKTTSEFEDEPFSLHTNPLKRPRGSELCNVGAKRHRGGHSEHMMTDTFSHHTKLSLPRGETDLSTDNVIISRNAGSQDHLKYQTKSEIPRESESTCQHDMKRLCAGVEQTQTPRNALNECDMEQEEMGTEDCYTCPLGQSELDSNKGTDSEDTDYEYHSQNPESSLKSSDIASQSESRCLGVSETFLTSNEVSSAATDEGRGRFDEDLVFQSCPQRQPGYVSKVRRLSARQRSQWKKTIQKRKLALQTKKERATLPSHNVSVKKSKCINQNPRICFPICMEIGLDLDVTSKSAEKQKLDLKLLTRAVVVEIHKFAIQKFADTVFDILDYNFDVSSQHHRRWEFSLATASKIKTVVKQYRQNRDRAGDVFKLPFVFPPKTSQGFAEKRPKKKPDEKGNEGSFMHQVRYHSDNNTLNFLGVKTEESWTHKEDTKPTTDLWTENMQLNGSVVSVSCGSPLQENIQIKEEEDDPHYDLMEPEPDTEEYYPHCEDVTTGTNTGDVKHLVPDEPAGTLVKAGNEDNLQDPKSCDIPRELRCLVVCAPLKITTNITSSLVKVNSTVNPLFASKADEKGLCGGQQQTQTQRNAPKESVVKQEDMGQENNYTCPVEGINLKSGKLTDSGNSGNDDHLKNPERISLRSDIASESESSYLGVSAPLLTSLLQSSTVNSNMDLPFASQLREKGFCGDEEVTETSRNVLNKCYMAVGEMVTENDMWKLRANRVEQILSERDSEFSRSKKVGLEFNVGFGPKQNISVDSLTDPVLLEIATFAFAMNSSQMDFIMEIIEYNFDIKFETQHHRNIFALEIMNRVRQLRSGEEAVKFSNEIFELPGSVPSINITHQSLGSVTPEFSSNSRMEKCDVTPVCDPHSHAETKEHISPKSMGLYPWCKEIGLKLQVNISQLNKKLEINRLTNGAMSEVADFAEELCGTFKQICLDILRHNFDLDLQSGDSERERNILARIYAAMEQANLTFCTKACKKIPQTRKNISTVERLDCQNNPNLDACSAGSSQAAGIDQNVGGSTDVHYKNELNFKLWKLRANHIQHILSVPHEEHCPLNSYSRCKKLGIDFNVGSGVKQNLDPKLLTNGIMVELNTFATKLLSAREYFVTEILEHNFDLNFKNELSRSAFAEETMCRIMSKNMDKRGNSVCTARLNLPFELPDIRCIQESTSDCPSCYQARNCKHSQDESGAGHLHHPRPHTMTDTVSADANCTPQKPEEDPSSPFSTTEERIMEWYPRCKKVGLNLFVDKDPPKDKLDTHVLTCGIMMEVAALARRMTGTNYKVINDVLEHNFDFGTQSKDRNPALLFQRVIAQKHDRLAWLDEAFDIQSYPRREPGYRSTVEGESALCASERKEIIKKRKLALQTKEGKTTLPSHMSVVQSDHQSPRNSYPICRRIGLELNVTSKSGRKRKLDLKLLTRAVVLEIHDFASHELSHYYPRTVFDILDCNFDLSSQYHRRWEFSIATAAKIQTMVKQCCKNLDGAEEVFRLPFAFDPMASEGFVGICAPFLSSAAVSTCLPTVNSDLDLPFGSQPDKRGLCRGGEQIQTPTNVANECGMEQEEIGTENYYTCPLGESDLDLDEVSDSENNGNEGHSENAERISLSSDIAGESKSHCLGVSPTFLASTHVSSTLSTVHSNVDLPFEKELCRVEEKTKPPRCSTNDCNMEVEELGTANMWRLRSNRVEQILSALNKECGPFNRSKKIGLEFNVGFGPKQNISVDSLIKLVLREIAAFAFAMNSSQKDFIMEIIEYNFDIKFETQHHRNSFAWEIMNRVRQLRSGEEAVKFSNEIFELPGSVPSINITHQSLGSVTPELSSSSRMEKCDVTPVCDPHSHAETKEHISPKSMGLYPWCKEIGLKLQVNNSQPNKKLEINRLTNGAMSEVADFAEELCGTFEEICLDILRHNFDLDLQSGDSDLARDILVRIHTAMEERKSLSPHVKGLKALEQANLTFCIKACKKILQTRNNISTVEKLGCPDNLNLDACSAGSSQAAGINQNVGGSTDVHHKNELNLKLWKLRANHIQHILSIPHEEHCPLYSYSRCKKLGIDFNVGSGVKQNLDPKLLTNGIMVELNTFATALLSARKYFVTEILEYNFNLNFKNELSRSAFAEETMTAMQGKLRQKRYSAVRQKMHFELPDMRSIQEWSYAKAMYCPKCYHNRYHKLCQGESDHAHMNVPNPHTVTDTVAADANCTAQKPAPDPSSTFSTTEDAIMNSYPRCKKIGLNLCVDKDKPKDKLDVDVLTLGIMMEIGDFAQILCGAKSKTVYALVEHNFNIDKVYGDKDLEQMFQKAKELKDGRLDWLSEAFVFQPVCRTQHQNVTKNKQIRKESAMKETIQKRKLALQRKEERATLPSHNVSVKKSKYINQNPRIHFPLCTEIGLDLDVTSKSAKKQKLDLKLLTRAVVVEIHKFATQKFGQYFPDTVFDILDYNFDVSSQHYRRWEFSIATATKIKTMVKQYRQNRDRAGKVFKLPFVFPPETKKSSRQESDKKRNEGSSVLQVGYHSAGSLVSFLHDKDMKSPTCTRNVQMNESVMSGCGNPLQGNIQIKEEEYDPHYGHMKPEPDIEVKYHPHYDEVKTESNTGDLVQPVGSPGYTLPTVFPNSERNVIIQSPSNEGVLYYMLPETQRSDGQAVLAVWPNTVQYLIPVEAAASQEYSIITTGQNSGSTLIQEEQGNVPAGSYRYSGVSCNKREGGIKQE